MRKIIYPLTFILFLFVENPYLKLLCTISFLIINISLGKKVRIIPNILLILTLSMLEQFTPRGLVLHTIGPFDITKGSLEAGLYKSSLLIGTIYLSKIITTGIIILPGRVGILISDIFSYFNQLSSGPKLSPANLINDLDNKLLNLNCHERETEKNSSPTKLQMTPLITTLILLALDITII